MGEQVIHATLRDPSERPWSQIVSARVELVRRYAKRSAGPYTDSDVAVERGEALVLILSRVLLSCSS